MLAFVLASITLIKCKVVCMAQFTLIWKGLPTGAHIFGMELSASSNVSVICNMYDAEKCTQW